MGRCVDVDDLVDAWEIAARLHLSDDTVVRNWAKRHADFPAAVKKFGKERQQSIWAWADVEAWAVASGREHWLEKWRQRP